MSIEPLSTEHVDVLIVGAGISGIGAGYHLQTNCPEKTYAILEAREAIGGTWDLFRYPGIRSDSDMYTLGYSFRPWTNPKAIADGPAILGYVRETAEAYGIDRKIRFGHQRRARAWSSARRAVDGRVERGPVAGARDPHLRLPLHVRGLLRLQRRATRRSFPGSERFRGRVVHPQKWTRRHRLRRQARRRHRQRRDGGDAGAGARRRRAAHVTMLQRSPTYIVARPAEDGLANWLRERLPPKLGVRRHALEERAARHGLLRADAGASPSAPSGSRRPGAKSSSERRSTSRQHFTPSYKPWDQRLCLVPDGDLFARHPQGAGVGRDRPHRDVHREGHPAAIGAGARGGPRRHGDGLEAQVPRRHRSSRSTARRIEPSKTMAYKGMMCSDVPNLALAIGYTNASWTLKCDLTCEYVCRLLNHMDARGYTQCAPRQNDPSVTEEPLLDFSSGYIQRAIDQFPRQGSRSAVEALPELRARPHGPEVQRAKGRSDGVHALASSRPGRPPNASLGLVAKRARRPVCLAIGSRDARSTGRRHEWSDGGHTCPVVGRFDRDRMPGRASYAGFGRASRARASVKRLCATVEHQA